MDPSLEHRTQMGLTKLPRLTSFNKKNVLTLQYMRTMQHSNEDEMDHIPMQNILISKSRLLQGKLSRSGDNIQSYMDRFCWFQGIKQCSAVQECLADILPCLTGEVPWHY